MKKALLILVGFALSANIINAQCIVAKYDFSGNSNDISGNKHNLTNVNATLTKDRFGRNNNAYNFDGSQYLWCDAPSSFSNDKFSISFWAKLNDDNTENARVIAVGPESTFWHYYSVNIVSSLKRYGFVAHDVNGNYNFNDYTKKNYTTNEWVHIVSTYDGDSIKMYINGDLNFKSKVVGKVVKFTSDKILQIGAAYHPDSPKVGYKGDLDDITIYCQSLTEKEVKDLYNKEVTLSTTLVDVNQIDVSISPNPATHTVYLNHSFEDNSMIEGEILDYQGKSILTIANEAGNKSIPIDISMLTAGIYFVKVSDSNKGWVKTVRLSIL